MLQEKALIPRPQSKPLLPRALLSEGEARVVGAGIYDALRGELELSDFDLESTLLVGRI
ncbi:MAG: hypothetical protein ACI9RO_000393 [Alteromonas macleodii]|jgi:hypothetical protein